MTTKQTPLFHLEDYRPTPYALVQTYLTFQLSPDKTKVISRVFVKPHENIAKGAPLVLQGDELKLVSLMIDNAPLSQNAYAVSPDKLEIFAPPTEPFTLEVVTEINPEKNRQLMGLYRSNGVFCTQCEAEGFRRITYFYDRPDVLSVYTVRIEADKKTNPVLLSNGNLQEKGELAEGRHFSVWHDPHPKPSYLFALVAGDLESIHDEFVTTSGRSVALGIFVEKGKGQRALYAMDSLKRAMRWDEEKFGREYDLDIFNIVAVSDFNMGAMENKGLNIFNDKYILANPETASDSDYDGIERVVAHEYFHNWTGDRITCRDWFQLCLKEGLTVYRDQEFSADQRSRAVRRIADVRLLKAAQFPEDAGPLAHPVRPRQYREINNFYTTTVYEKGAEVVRMIHTILGETLFRKGMDLYFERFDGQAVTIEDFIACFADVSDHDFSQFMLWYEQAGTPHVETEFLFKNGIFEITFEQKIQPTPGQSEKRPMVIPIRFGFVGEKGQDLPYEAESQIEGDVMMLTERRQTFRFRGFNAQPVVSLLRGFSAPVIFNAPFSDDELLYLARHDSDTVNRWQSLNRLIMEDLVISARAGRCMFEDKRADIIDVLGEIADDRELEPAFRALCLSLPTEGEIARQVAHDVNPDAIHKARKLLHKQISETHNSLFEKKVKAIDINGAYSPDATQEGRRAFVNVLLGYISAAQEMPSKANAAYLKADNMTNRSAALALLAHQYPDSLETASALKDFEKRYHDDPLVMDKWFAIQATIPGETALERVKALTKHKLFSLDNPNRTRALIASFASANQTGFNRPDGASYMFLAKTILTIDAFNPQLAARLLTLLRSWQQLEPQRQEKAKTALQTIAAADKLSTDVADIVNRMLANAN